MNLNNQLLLIIFIMAALHSGVVKSQNVSVTDGHFIEVDGINLHYRTGGNGPVLLLLHGFTLSSEQWLPFFNQFAGDYTILAMDMPGHGKSDMLGERFSFERWADLMQKMLAQMGIEKVYASGHSAGAITLMHLASQNPDLIESMILVDGAHRYSESAREELRHDSFEKAPEAFQQYYLDIHFSEPTKISALFEDINYMADQIPVSLENAPLNERTLANITAPVLLIWGDRDFYFPLDVAVELFKLLPNAKLWVIPDQGHTPIWTFMGGDGMAERDFPGRAKLFFGNPEHQQ